PGLDEPLRRDRLAVDGDALPHGVQVRGGEAPGPQVRLTQQPFDHAGGGGLPVGAGEVDDLVGAVRVAEELEDVAHPVEAGLDVVLGCALQHLRVDATDLLLDGGLLAAPVRGPAAHRAPTLVTETSAAPLPPGATVRSTASVSRAMRSRWASTAATLSAGTVRSRRMRSATYNPTSFRVSWTWRTRSRAYPSAASSSSTARSRTTNPPPASSAARESPPTTVGSTSVASSYSPGSRAMPSTMTPPSVSSHRPSRAARMTRWTCLPSRGPAARALTVSLVTMP